MSGESAVRKIHGGLPRRSRKAAQDDFTADPRLPPLGDRCDGEIKELVEAARRHCDRSIRPNLAAAGRAALQRQRQTGITQVRTRLTGEITRLSRQLSAAESREIVDSSEVERLQHAIADLRRRLASREAGAAASFDLTAEAPETVAIAWVEPGVGHDMVRARGLARHRVCQAIESEGTVEEALPHAGFDFLLAPSEGAPSFVTIKGCQSLRRHLIGRRRGSRGEERPSGLPGRRGRRRADINWRSAPAY